MYQLALPIKKPIIIMINKQTPYLRFRDFVFISVEFFLLNLPCFDQSRQQWRRDVPSRDQPSISQCDQFVQIFGKAKSKTCNKELLNILISSKTTIE